MSIEIHPANAVHLVPVPAEDLDAVLELLGARAKIRSGRSESLELPRAESESAEDGVSGSATEKNEFWTEQMLTRIATSDVLSLQVLRDVMDVIAADPTGGEEFTRESLVGRIEHSSGRLANALTKLSPHFNKHFGTTLWPISGQNGLKFDPKRANITFYWMTPVILDRWRRVRSL